MMSTDKIAGQHLDRLAVVYVRQSTLQQVDRHQESTRLQYGLAEHAVRLGWPHDRVLVIDEDLGRSGASIEGRLGFQRLVAEVGLGHVGLVLGIEMSRLARSCRDWHQLLEICALCDTLIGDADGIYNPGGYNDRLLLGLKGTISEAELHILQARMHEGRRSKARRGELWYAPPRGYVRAPGGGIVLDPDEQVQATIRLVFDVFERRGTITAVLRHLVGHGLRLPCRPPCGLAVGELEWRRPSRQALVCMLYSPVYAGAYAYGRGVTDGRRSVGRQRNLRRIAIRPEEYQVLIRDRVPAYISWERFEGNLAVMTANRSKAKGVPRRGPSLLAGLLTCGRCGARMVTCYRNNGRALQYACMQEVSTYGGDCCQCFSGRCLDEHISGLILQALEPAAVEISLRLAEDLELERADLHRAWRQRLERAAYEVERARRQYDAVEPENRLVVRTLEQRWEKALTAEAALKDEYERFLAQRPPQLSSAEMETIRRLSADVPALWSAETTTAQDRQEIARLLIDEIIVTIQGTSEMMTVDCIWAGGMRLKTVVQRPVARLSQLSTYHALVSRAVALCTEGRTMGEIAAVLNEEGWRPAKRRNTFTPNMVANLLRRGGHVPRSRVALRDMVEFHTDEMLLRDVATALGMPEQTAYFWLRRGLLAGRKVAVGNLSLWIVKAGPHELARLRQLRQTKSHHRSHVSS